MKLNYVLSEKALNDIYIASGKLPNTWGLSLDVSEESLTPEQRQSLIPLLRFGSVSIFVKALKPNRTQGKASPVKFSIEGAGEYKFDSVPTVEEWFAALAKVQAEKTALELQRPALEAEYEAMYADWKIKDDERKAREAEAKRLEAEEQERQRQAAMTIAWSEDGKAIVNLYDALWAASKMEPDSRFANWAKEITGVYKSINNGYCFSGDFVHDCTVQIERKPGVYLIAATSGSRKHNTTDYRVVVMDKGGVLSLTDIETDNRDAGWALRIRDRIAALLESLA